MSRRRQKLTGQSLTKRNRDRLSPAFAEKFARCDFKAQQNAIKKLRRMAARGKPTPDVSVRHRSLPPRQASKQREPVDKSGGGSVKVLILRHDLILVIGGHEEVRNRCCHRRYTSAAAALEQLLPPKRTAIAQGSSKIARAMKRSKRQQDRTAEQLESLFV